MVAQPYAYVANQSSNSVVVINRETNLVVATIPMSGAGLSGLAVLPNGMFVYVTQESKNLLAVISTATNVVVGSIPVGAGPVQVAFTPNGALA